MPVAAVPGRRGRRDAGDRARAPVLLGAPARRPPPAASPSILRRASTGSRPPTSSPSRTTSTSRSAWRRPSARCGCAAWRRCSPGSSQVGQGDLRRYPSGTSRLCEERSPAVTAPWTGWTCPERGGGWMIRRRHLGHQRPDIPAGLRRARGRGLIAAIRAAGGLADGRRAARSPRSAAARTTSPTSTAAPSWRLVSALTRDAGCDGHDLVGARQRAAVPRSDAGRDELERAVHAAVATPMHRKWLANSHGVADALAAIERRLVDAGLLLSDGPAPPDPRHRLVDARRGRAGAAAAARGHRERPAGRVAGRGVHRRHDRRGVLLAVGAAADAARRPHARGPARRAPHAGAARNAPTGRCTGRSGAALGIGVFGMRRCGRRTRRSRASSPCSG